MTYAVPVLCYGAYCNDDYHPIYATSIDGKDKSASDNDDAVPTNDDMEDNSCAL